MTTTSGRTFGVEIETVGISTDRARSALAEAGIDGARRTSYSDHEYGEWMAKPDCSLASPNGQSAEIVSPILTWGDLDSYRQIEVVCEALRDAGARINSSCGLHVHVGIGDLTRPELVSVARVYTAGQYSIDANVSPSRRDGEWAHYLPSFTTPDARPGRNTYYGATWNAFASSFIRDGHVQVDRRSTVNLMPYSDRGTVEFRQRNGSLSARKILTWAGLMVSIVKAGAEDESRSDLVAYEQAGTDPSGVWEMLAGFDALDPHAVAYRDGTRPVGTVSTGHSFARLLALQGR